jgi:16S rRNA (cytosine967-C5)-methyltransferase
MNSTSLLGHTFELFDRMVRESLPADQVVDKFFRTRHYLGSRDRRFIAEAVYGMIRHKLRLEAVFGSALREFDGHPAHSNLHAPVGLYLTYLLLVEKGNVQAISELLGSYWRIHFPSVQLDKITDAVIRIDEPNRATSSAADRLSLTYSFPKWMVDEWLLRLGDTEAEQLCVALNSPAPTTLRVNSLKTSVKECQARLLREGIETERTKVSPFGLILSKRANLPSLQSFKEGWFEVQDEGSQIISLLVDPQPGEFVIDACAGGGGKTLALASLMSNRGKIIALDVDEHRLKKLQRRAERAGAQNVEVHLAGKGSTQLGTDLPEKADAILIDAPCSGLGTLRRNPGNKWRVSPDFVEQVSLQQQRLLEQWSSHVKSGGRLTYATCTLTRKENEGVVESFLSRHGDFQLDSPSAILSKSELEGLSEDGFLYLYPHRHGTDGFFAAVMKRE